MRFVEGHIEYLDKAGLADESVDMVISNCVVNLSPDKARVLTEAYRVLAPGGEFYFSDVYCDRRLPQHVRQHKVRFDLRCACVHMLKCKPQGCLGELCCYVFLAAQCSGLYLVAPSTLIQRHNVPPMVSGGWHLTSCCSMSHCSNVGTGVGAFGVPLQLLPMGSSVGRGAR